MTRIDAFIFTFLVSLFFGTIFLHWDYDVDDAYISYRYAENLRTGFELAYNPRTPQEGYTSFLWIVLLAIASIFLPITYASKIIAMLSAIGIAFWFLRLSANKFTAWIAFALWLSLPITWMNSVNGMETILYTFFLTGCATLALECIETPSQKKAWLWTLLALLASLTRPEGNLFAFFLGTCLLITSRSRRIFLLPLTTAVILGSGYFIARIFYFDYPLNQPWPNPFLFKVATGEFFKDKGITYVRDFLREPLFPLLFFVAYTHFSHQANTRRFLVVGLAITGYLCFFFTVEPIVEYFYRFLIPVVPVLLLASLPSNDPPKDSLKLTLCVAIGCIFFGFWSEWQKQSISGLTTYFSTPLKRTHHPIGKALHSFKTKNYTLGVSDAGVLPYQAQWKTLDLVGLNHRPYLLTPATLTDFFQHPPTVLVLHEHPQGKACNIPLELLLTSQGKIELSRYYETIHPVFYHREDMGTAVYLLKNCEEKNALKEAIITEVKKAQQLYPKKP